MAAWVWVLISPGIINLFSALIIFWGLKSFYSFLSESIAIILELLIAMLAFFRIDNFESMVKIVPFLIRRSIEIRFRLLKT